MNTQHVVFGHPGGSSDKVRLKFDDEQPFNSGYNGASNQSMSTIFLKSTSQIIGKLSTSNKLVMELPVYGESRQRATFIIEGYSEVCTF